MRKLRKNKASGAFLLSWRLALGVENVWKLGEGSGRKGLEALYINGLTLGEVGEKPAVVQAEQEKNRIRYQPARVICSWYR